MHEFGKMYKHIFKEMKMYTYIKKGEQTRGKSVLWQTDPGQKLIEVKVNLGQMDPDSYKVRNNTRQIIFHLPTF